MGGDYKILKASGAPNSETSFKGCGIACGESRKGRLSPIGNVNGALVKSNARTPRFFIRGRSGARDIAYRVIDGLWDLNLIQTA